MSRQIIRFPKIHWSISLHNERKIPLPKNFGEARENIIMILFRDVLLSEIRETCWINRMWTMWFRTTVNQCKITVMQFLAMIFLLTCILWMIVANPKLIDQENEDSLMFLDQIRSITERSGSALARTTSWRMFFDRNERPRASRIFLLCALPVTSCSKTQFRLVHFRCWGRILYGQRCRKGHDWFLHCWA